MAGQESKQKYLGRNRPPRVQITYDVEIGNAFETTELPLVVGIFSDLSGNVPASPPVELSKRGFVDIDRDSFNTVLSKINPTLDFSVDSTLESRPDGPLKVNLSFKSIEDFSPQNIVQNVDVLKDLYAKRQKLQDLLIKLDGNTDLEKVFISNLSADNLKKLQLELKTAVSEINSTLKLSPTSVPGESTAEGGNVPELANKEPETPGPEKNSESDVPKA